MCPSGTQASPKTAAELRRAFLDFFRRHDHTVVPSSPLVPKDPTLLFTTAGMVQFKPYYSAPGDVPYTRACSIQKCLRLTDVDNVGLTPRHDTFFEMLGNFSFGPRAKGAYFKEEAILFAWEFVKQVLGIPKARLYASIFEGEGKLPRDDEAVALWKKIGLAEGHIVALGRKDNFWGPAGGAGACGPCSEIYFDLGEKRPSYLAPGAFWGEKPGDEGDRYMEFWNLVFPQYDAQKDGSLELLPRPGIDTGMGLERLALIVQGQDTIFGTDLFAPLVSVVTDMALDVSGVVAGGPETIDARIIADHIRAVCMAVSEAAMPGNEGAGYVLRRLLRRAAVRAMSERGLRLPADEVLPAVAKRVIDLFGPSYPELVANEKFVVETVERESAAFNLTYRAGLRFLELTPPGPNVTITGEGAFKLHDTYGFPIELTEEIARQRGNRVDRAGFEKEMEKQRERARSASKFAAGLPSALEVWQPVSEGPHSKFVGYDGLEVSECALRVWRPVDELKMDLVLDATPFYAEGGGQVGDSGVIGWETGRFDVENTFREGELIVHHGILVLGKVDLLVATGAAGGLSAHVDAAHRIPTMRHHTATHLLHAALRAELGTHAHQAGSLVAPDRLRFDYTHFEAPSAAQLETIEHRVNEWVLANRPVTWEILPLDEARARGAMALFGEKYGNEVRMVTVAGVEGAGIAPSLELCGGTHVKHTGEIGAFALVGDSAIASGVRRIEARCGLEALRHYRAEHELLARAAGAIQSGPAQLPDQLEKLKGELERLRKAAAAAQKGGLEAEMAKLLEGASAGPAGRWIVAAIESEADANAVRDAADTLRARLKRGAALLALASGGKLTFVAAVTDDLVAEKKLNASDLVKRVAQVAGGSGGGKPHLALAGGKDPAKLGDALAAARDILSQALAS